MSISKDEMKKALELLQKADDAQFLSLLDDTERCVFCGKDDENEDKKRQCRCDSKRPRMVKGTAE